MPKKAPVAPAQQSLPAGLETVVPAGPGRLHLARITIHRVLGVVDTVMDFAPDVTVIAAKNAEGKSSRLAAIRSVLGIDRTSLGRLTHLSEGVPDEGASIDVVLMGQDREVHVTRKGEGSPEVRERLGEDWRKVPRPAEWLRDLIDVEAANPALWLASKDEDKAAAVLAAMPIEGYDRAAALSEAGIPDFRLPPIPEGLHPLEDLEHVEDAVFGSRTVVNGDLQKEKDAAERLMASLPAEAPRDLADQVAQGEVATARLAEELAKNEAAADLADAVATKAAQAEQTKERERIAAHVSAEIHRVKASHAERAAEIRAKAEREIAELASRVEIAIDEIRDKGDQDAAKVDEAHLSAISQIAAERATARKRDDSARADLAKAREKLAALREQQKNSESDRRLRAVVQEAKNRAEMLRTKSAGLTKALDSLKRFKLKLAGTLPIQGLAVHFTEDGKKTLTLDGVPLATVNKARLAELATEVSVLRGTRPPLDGKPFLPLILLDDLERLDAESRVELLRAVAARGAQIVAAVVSDDSMRVLHGEAALNEVA